MKTNIVYYDETGDDGIENRSSDTFILTGLYMPSDEWQNNYNIIKNCRLQLKKLYGFHSSQEMHTKLFLTDKNPYREYKWDKETRIKILKHFIACIGSLEATTVNVIIDKTAIIRSDYNVLENALKYNIQRIENTSGGEWNYIIITDKGRLAPMRKTARAIRAYNPIKSNFDEHKYTNKPIKYMIEDIFEKDSQESYFVQISDFISYFVHLYYKTQVHKQELPNRIKNLIDEEFVLNTMNYFKSRDIFNLKANSNNDYGLVVYPKK